MKAIRIHNFGGPEVLALEQVPELSAGPGEVLVRVKAVGVNPVDTYIRSGSYGDREFPYTPGMDAAGTVVGLGDGSIPFSGQRAGLRGRELKRDLRRADSLQRIPGSSPSFTYFI